MSATITQTRTHPPSRLLADYELHHSGEADNSSDVKDSDETAASSAPYWDVPHRRVPAYRPVDTNRDQSQVRVYNNPIERAFITTMFTGLYINAVSICFVNEGIRKRTNICRSQRPRHGGPRLEGSMRTSSSTLLEASFEIAHGCTVMNSKLVSWKKSWLQCMVLFEGAQGKLWGL